MAPADLCESQLIDYSIGTKAARLQGFPGEVDLRHANSELERAGCKNILATPARSFPQSSIELTLDLSGKKIGHQKG
jgi:hypothetical protein